MADNHGRFSGNPKTEWLSENGADRRMRLLEEFWFEAPDGRRWSAPAESVVDGASIPAPLWSVVGSPFTGEYRRASIVHDIACDDPTVNRKAADRMFYHACLAGGCTLMQARLLYVGVRIGAWTPDIRLWSNEAVTTPASARDAVDLTLTDTSMQMTFREIASDVQARPETFSLDELEALVDHHLSAKAQQ